MFRGYPAHSTALTGCADMKRLIAHYAPARERYNEPVALLQEANNILGDGAARLLPPRRCVSWRR